MPDTHLLWSDGGPGLPWPVWGRRATIPLMVSHQLPGENLIADGIRDLGQRAPTAAALLVSVGAPRLRRLGYAVPDPFPDAEHALYLLLAREHPATAHSRYNALVRRLVSFERAAACAG
jgi:hypothetical protein